jgi:hypothetical protein
MEWKGESGYGVNIQKKSFPLEFQWTFSNSYNEYTLIMLGVVANVIGIISGKVSSLLLP